MALPLWDFESAAARLPSRVADHQPPAPGAAAGVANPMRAAQAVDWVRQPSAYDARAILE